MSKLSPKVKMLIVFLFVMISLLLIFPPLQKYYNERDNLYKSNKELENVLAQTDIENMSDEVLVESARFLTFSRHSEELETYLQEMEKRPTVNKTYLFLVSEDHMNNFRYDEAQNILEELVKQYPNDIVVVVRYATLTVLSDPKGTLNILNQVIDIPEEKAAYYKGIIKTVEQFISLKTNSDLKAYEFLLNSNLYSFGPTRILYLEKLIQNKDTHMNEEYDKYHIELGNLYSVYGDTEKALAAYRSVKDQSGSVSGFMGLEYLKNEDREGLSKLLATVPKDTSEEYMLLGIKAYMEGNYGDASGWYEKSLLKDENNLINHYLMVFSHHYTGSKTKAIKHHTLFIEDYSKGINGELPFSWDYYGNLLDILGDQLRIAS